MLRRIIVAVVASLAATVPARAAQEKPARDKPAAAASKPADAGKGSPAEKAALRATLKTLAKALQEGDGERIKQVIHAADPTERKMVDAMTAMAVQIAQLHKASAKAFGEEQAKSLTGDVNAEMSRIDEAEVSVDGDTATVRYAAPADPEETPKSTDKPGDETKPAGDPPASDAAADDDDAPAAAPTTPLVLKKVDGHWRVPMAELSKGSTPEEIEQRLADVEAQTKVVAELTAEIGEGKYKSAEKAAEAWQAKMMQALTPRKGDADKAKPAGADKSGKAAQEKPK